MRPRFERTVRHGYGWLLALYPRSFRHRFGEDMADTFLDRYRTIRARGRLALLLFLLRSTLDAAVNGLAERWTHRPSHPSPRRSELSVFYWQDIRYAFRLLGKSPLFTLLTVVVLAGGLGVSIFTFSFLYTAMLKPLPVAGGEDIVRLMAAGRRTTGLLDAADLAAIRPRITALTGIGLYINRPLVIGTGEGTRPLDAVAAEWNIFEVTRTPPAAGRGFRPDDQLPGAEPVIVLSDWAWRVMFGREAGIVGRQVAVNGASTRVIGIMPPGYGFPVAAEAWVPIAPELLTATVPDRQQTEAYARLVPGWSSAEASAQLSALLLPVRQARPAPDSLSAAESSTGMEVQTFPMAQMGEEGPLVLAILNTLATLILLLACINVTNLLLARANERARETAVRLALGAPRIRLALQSMWESVILCLLGGGLATGLALWGLSATTTWTRAHLEGNLAFWWNWGFDRTVLLAAGAFVTVAIAVLGGATAIRTANTRFNAILQEGGARTGNRREGRVARGVVVVQVATVSILMFFGSMSAIVARRVATMNLGYDTRNLSSTSFDLPVERYPDGAARRRFFQSFYDRLAARAEIDGVVLRAPLADITDRSGTFELRHEPGRSASPNTYVRAVLGPLTTLGVALREGRSFDSRDHETSEPTAIVSRSFALRYWPGHSPLGRQIRLAGLGATEPWRTVVGVVDDVLLGNPLSRDQSAIAVYVPLRQTAATSATVLFRHRGNPIAGQVAFQQVLADIDPLIAPPRVQSYEEVLAKSTLMANSVTKLFGACFGFALLLAASGTYGLMARSIGRRTREIGVRRALGATDRTILVMLLSQGGRQLGIGAVVALPVMVAIGIGFAHFFPIEAGVAIVTAIAASTFVSTVVLAATWLPTRRAVAIEPRDALWQE